MDGGFTAKDIFACPTSTILLLHFSHYSAHVSGVLFSLGAKVGTEKSGGTASSDCRQL